MSAQCEEVKRQTNLPGHPVMLCSWLLWRLGAAQPGERVR